MSINTTLVSGHQIIVAPVNPAEVAKVLRTYGGDVGWVCSRGTLINKWAKYKPVVLANVIDSTVINGVAQLDKSTNKWLSTATWWKGDNNQCGLVISVPSNVSSATSDADKTSSTLASEATSLDTWFANGYGYIAPNGALTSPFRLIDYNYYDRDAQPPVVSITYPRSDRPYYAGDQADGESITMTLTFNTETNYALTINDIAKENGTTLGNMYFGCIFVKTGGTTYHQPEGYKFIISTSNKKLSASGGNTITLSMLDAADMVDDKNIRQQQEFAIYPVLCNQPIYRNQASDVYGLNTFGASTGARNVTFYCVPEIKTVGTLKLWPNALDAILRFEGYQGDTSNLVRLQIAVPALNFWQTDISITRLYIALTTGGVRYEAAYGSNPISGSFTIQVLKESYYGTAMTFPVTMAGSGSEGAWSYGDNAGDLVMYVVGTIDADKFDMNRFSIEGTFTYVRNGTTGTATLMGFSYPA